jgi:hypothetical protein
VFVIDFFKNYFLKKKLVSGPTLELSAMGLRIYISEDFVM